MNEFSQGCEACSHRLGLEPEQCFHCANVEPWMYNDAHSLGVYFCRAMPQHHSSEWSKAIIKFKQGFSPVISAMARMAAFYLQASLTELRPYVLTNVPTWMNEEKQRLFPKLDFGVTRRLALAAFRSFKNTRGTDCRQLLALTGSKKKRQRECRSRAERQRNTDGAYMVCDPQRVENMNIIILDDVLTTGSTLRACGLALKQAGAKQVVPVVLGVTARKENGYGNGSHMRQMQDSVLQREFALPGVS